MAPVYESSTTLYIINKRADAQLPLAYNDLIVGEYLVKDYRELIKSRTITGTVIDELKLKGFTPGNLAAMVTVNSKNDTRIIEIKVQDTDPERARDIANKLGEVFIAKVVDLMKAENVNIVDPAEIPVNPVSPRPMVNIAVAVFTGLMAAVGLAFFLEYMDDSIKTSEDVEKYLKLNVLGTIPALNLK
jgi:capsular polysaccharide biosynthesis protein